MAVKKEENPNMMLWRSVEKTDPKHTKQITGKTYGGTAPKPYWLIQRATETFGPMGIGWGAEELESRIENGMWFSHVRVWYKWGGEKGFVEQWGGTAFAYTSSKGREIVDEDAPKKSFTDALTKCLSYIGFAGDIHIGRFDDSKYVAGLEKEETAKARNARYAEIKALIEEAPTLEMLKAVWMENADTIHAFWQQDEQYHADLVQTKDKRKAELEEQNERNASGLEERK